MLYAIYAREEEKILTASVYLKNNNIMHLSGSGRVGRGS